MMEIWFAILIQNVVAWCLFLWMQNDRQKDCLRNLKFFNDIRNDMKDLREKKK